MAVIEFLVYVYEICVDFEDFHFDFRVVKTLWKSAQFDVKQI